MALADASLRSRILSLIQGPRSFTRTVADFPFRILITVMTDPRGIVLLAAVRSVVLYCSPEDVRLCHFNWDGSLPEYVDAIPHFSGWFAIQIPIRHITISDLIARPPFTNPVHLPSSHQRPL